jgi:tRNA 2-selenouridine synthase
MAWLFSLAGVECSLLDGGYKSYRHHVLEYLGEKRKYLILGGLTGSGKTELLKYFEGNGEQVIDLEGIACHKGSAFGSLGQPPQPSSEHFANLLFSKMRALDTGKPIWLEDESKNIGTVFMPDQFWFNMQESPVVALLADVKTRMPRLLREYSEYAPGELKDSVMKISRRLGGDNTRESIESIDSGNISRAIEITLEYYDKSYMYGLRRRSASLVHYVETGTDDISVNAGKILEEAARISF